MFDSGRSWWRWLSTPEGIVAIVIFLLTIAFTAVFALYADKAADMRAYIAKHWPLIRTAIIALVLLGLTFYSGMRWGMSHSTGDGVKKEERGRWDNIQIISCSYIENPPLCYTKLGEEQPDGVGLCFLKFAFPQCRINVLPVPTAWDRVVAGIRDGKSSELDTCLSPLYETFERQKDVVFSAPLFYANIGLYVPSSFSDKHTLSNLSFREARERLRELGTAVHFGGVEGEISAKLARKYSEDKEGVRLFPQFQQNVTGLVNLLGKPTPQCNAVFFESLLGDVTKAVSEKKVVNILRHKELLYPVGFALRRGDYLLRTLINLKILEARDNGQDLIKAWTIEHCSKYFGPSVDACKHFVTEDNIVITSQEMGEQYAT